METGSNRQIEVTGVGDDERERAQIYQIVDAADAGERAEIASRRARETEWRLVLGLGAGEWLSRHSPLIYSSGGVGLRGGDWPVTGWAASRPAVEERVAPCRPTCLG